MKTSWSIIAHVQMETFHHFRHDGRRLQSDQFIVDVRRRTKQTEIIKAFNIG